MREVNVQRGANVVLAVVLAWCVLLCAWIAVAVPRHRAAWEGVSRDIHEWWGGASEAEYWQTIGKVGG